MWWEIVHFLIKFTIIGIIAILIAHLLIVPVSLLFSFVMIPIAFVIGPDNTEVVSNFFREDNYGLRILAVIILLLIYKKVDDLFDGL